jgi:hypothetical protein
MKGPCPFQMDPPEFRPEEDKRPVPVPIVIR